MTELTLRRALCCPCLQGPFYPTPGGAKLTANEFAWNKVTSLLFLDSPAFVGWSYSNRTADIVTGEHHACPGCRPPRPHLGPLGKSAWQAARLLGRSRREALRRPPNRTCVCVCVCVCVLRSQWPALCCLCCCRR